jgi:hypothetical protein
LLAELHPSRLREMQLDVLVGLGPDATFSRRVLAAALDVTFRAKLPAVALALVRHWPSRWATTLRHRVYDYLVLSRYAQGLASTGR